jgi:hypothetical protein
MRYSINLLRYGILKMVKLGIQRLKAKLWLKLWLKIPKRIVLKRFNINLIIGLNAFLRSVFMHNLDQFTHKQIKVRRLLCKFVSDCPGYASINSGKNALNSYNSVTKYFFFHLFWKFIFGDPQYAHQLMCVGHE